MEASRLGKISFSNLCSIGGHHPSFPFDLQRPTGRMKNVTQLSQDFIRNPSYPFGDLFNSAKVGKLLEKVKIKVG